MKKPQLLIISLIVTFIFSNVTRADTLKFAQITDVHYEASNSSTTESRVISTHNKLQFLVQSLNKQDIAFSVFLGDNIDKSQMPNLIGFCETIYSLNMPYYIALGNHDVHKISGITKEDYINFAGKHNRYRNIKKSYYYFYPNKNTIAIVMDGSMPFMPTKHGQYTDEEINWLDKTLEKNPNKIALIFQHFPLIIPDETRNNHEVLDSDKYYDLLIKHKNIILISTGHYHKERVTIDENGIYHISAPAFNGTNMYEIIEVTYDENGRKLPTNVKININKIKI